MRRVCTTFHHIVPVLSNQIEGGRTPTPGVRKLEEMGYALALFPLGTAFAAAKGMKNYLEVLAATGDTRGALKGMILFEEFNKLIGLDEHTELEERYRTPPADDAGQARAPSLPMATPAASQLLRFSPVGGWT